MTRHILPAILLFIFIVPHSVFGQSAECLLPITVENRTTWASVQLTQIGSYGITRKARPGIPKHLHTGVDIKRPRPNYADEPVLPVASGTVISMRDDGPFAQIIIEHRLPHGDPVWTAYEHIAGITVTVGDIVSPHEPIGRFMNRQELDSYEQALTYKQEIIILTKVDLVDEKGLKTKNKQLERLKVEVIPCSIHQHDKLKKVRQKLSAFRLKVSE